MADEVEKGTDAASSQEEVKKEDVAASTTQDDADLDLATELAKSLEREQAASDRASKAEGERDNYKKGMLKAKGKLTDEETEETENAGQETTSLAEAQVVKPLIRRIRELEAAAAAKQSMSNTGQGGNTEVKAKVGDNILSEAQLAALKAQGKDDKWIARFKENLQKAKA